MALEGETRVKKIQIDYLSDALSVAANTFAFADIRLGSIKIKAKLKLSKT